MRDFMIHGTFHFHSTYSHDGKNALSEIASALRKSGFSFCLMTEHFEDFDAEKFDRYVQEAKDVSASTGFLLIPGVEVDLSGLHTIVFPARSFAEITRLATDGQDSDRAMFRVLAHPSKYSFVKVARHVEKYKINGIELWNQMADGRYMPPTDFLRQVRKQAWRNQFRGFFGCDIHNIKSTPANKISIAMEGDLTAEAVMNALIEGNFVSRNDLTGIEYRNGSDRTNFDTWLDTLQGKLSYRGRILGSVRSFLKPIYRMLPRDLRHSLNGVKNFVRDKV